MGLSTVTSRRLSPLVFRRITLVAVVALGFVIVTGGAVRLTGSGLGCPQWPDCARGHLVASFTYHAQIEFINRVTTLAVSVAMIGAAVAALLRNPRRRDLTWLGMGLAAGLVAEIVIGGETVRHRLDPAFVMAHFLLSMVVMWDAVVLHHRAGQPDGARRQPSVDRDLMWLGRLLVLSAATTIVAGTVVTGAGPHSGANAADGRVTRWHLDLHRVTQVHGVSAMALLALVVATWWLLRSRRAPAEARHRLEVVLEALAVQITIGYTQYLTGVPAILVAAHILGAVLVWTAVVRFALTLGSGTGPVAGAPRAREARYSPVGTGPRSPTRV